MTYELHYWPGIQGRGEYVRLAFEESGTQYREIAHERIPDVERPPFAAPYLKAGKRVIGQTPNILLFLGTRLGLAPRDAAGKLWTHQLQLTIGDFIDEIHDVHHPLGPTLYYEDQKVEAKRRAREFRQTRMPKYLDYFEDILERNTAGPEWLVDGRLTYADLSIAQVEAGLRYAFPKSAAKAYGERPRLAALARRVWARPRIKRYLASERRIAFNNDDLFRRYPELGD
jgi:glutathione S-transferase